MFLLAKIAAGVVIGAVSMYVFTHPFRVIKQVSPPVERNTEYFRAFSETTSEDGKTTITTLPPSKNLLHKDEDGSIVSPSDRD